MKKIIMILLAILYAASPYDLLPDFLIGWGWLDDLFIGYLLYRYVLFPVASRAFDRDARSERRERSRADGDSSSGGPAGSGGAYDHGRQERKDPFAVLGLESGASKDEIQKAYRTLANKYHPDKVQHLGEEFRVLAEERFKEIRQAYTVLMER
ncbi:MAG: Chaperone protein DnaJ [Deltaproteobacteria bacterium ADurb.BinA179]|jgi:DnaJ like chaperone protein|nr:DnaJ domain-containing protein [Deltaproteobacteria bacterium]MDI9541415.1 DnaJ domain-containing protein [Pseudomonadota bacterium]OPZ29489.1 MAG: Chaperone protein DnaJ [Deltaproteobacteria bacterium ADurb.BinA179]HNU74411.1 DnaJ domain-containing protein [Deltaproteobacteria bacterium]HOD71197.1 DnaJ domain-containing protein [Deltaproteobacteria bacterium]